MSVRTGIAWLITSAYVAPVLGQAQTPLTGHYPPGQSGIRGAAMASPGLVYTNFSRLFSNLEVTDASGHGVESLDELRYANISFFAWTTDRELFGLRVDELARVPLSFPTYTGILVRAAYRAVEQLGRPLRSAPPRAPLVAY